MYLRGATLRLDDRTSLAIEDLRFSDDFGYAENDTTIRVFILAYAKFLSDSPLTKQIHAKRDVMSFIGHLTRHHVKDVIVSFANLSHSILSQEDESSGPSQGPFILAMKSTPIFREYLSWYRTRDPELLKYIISFLTFGKKLEYADEEFETTAFRGWLEVENRLAQAVFDDVDSGNLLNIITALTCIPERHDWFPKFGPGRVAERKVKNVYGKFESLALDRKLAYAFARNNHAFAWEYGLGPNWAPAERTDEELCSRLCFVPKDMTKARSICMEPNAYMYYQQEVLDLMIDSIDGGRAGRFITLSDQQNNRDGATFGSKTRLTDTIDLSSASDSVHVDLVRKIFPKRLLYWMLAVRSSRVILPDGTKYRPYKFAPMGSAICFPTQCLIFLSVAVYAAGCVASETERLEHVVSSDGWGRFIDLHFHPHDRIENPTFRDFYQPYVYGDDIVCDSRTTDVIMKTLDRLAFTVNRRKSFMGSQKVRESCGIYCYEGEDITPILYRVPALKLGPMQSDVYSSLVAAVNTFSDNGYTNVRGFLLSLLKESVPRGMLPIVLTKDLFGVHVSRKRFEPEERYKIDPNYQVGLQRVMGLRTVADKDKPGGFDSYSHSLWWRSKRRSMILQQSVGLRVRPEETRIVSVWSRYDK